MSVFTVILVWNRIFTECNCLFTFICKDSARVLYVYVIIACSLKRKLMCHRSVE
jgi:hypothetical protein